VTGDILAQTEGWCHLFAEAFLVDREAFQARQETRAVVRREPGYQQALRYLASSFKVSQQVILFRLWHMGLVSEQRHWAEYARVRQEAEAELAQQGERQQRGAGGPPPARQAVQKRGRLFTRLVLEGLERQTVSYTEAIDYLDIRLKNLEKVRQEAYR